MEPLSPEDGIPSAPPELEDVLRLSATAEEELLAEGQPALVARLRALGPRLGEALDWAAEHDPERGVSLAAALWPYFVVAGELSEGRQQLRWLLVLVPASSVARLAGLTSAALLATVAGAHAEAALLVQDAMPLARALDDEVRLGHLELVLARRAQADGNLPLARAHFEAAREYLADAGRVVAMAGTLLGLGALSKPPTTEA